MIFEVLRRAADRDESIEVVAVADRRRPLDARVGADPRFVADRDTPGDDAVRSDCGVVRDARFAADDCRRMDHSFGLSTMMLNRSASATTVPSTVAVPFTFTLVARRCWIWHSSFS